MYITTSQLLSKFKYSIEEIFELKSIFDTNFNTNEDHNDFYAWLFESNKLFLLNNTKY